MFERVQEMFERGSRRFERGLRDVREGSSNPHNPQCARNPTIYLLISGSISGMNRIIAKTAFCNMTNN